MPEQFFSLSELLADEMNKNRKPKPRSFHTHDQPQSTNHTPIHLESPEFRWARTILIAWSFESSAVIDEYSKINNFFLSRENYCSTNVNNVLEVSR